MSKRNAVVEPLVLEPPSDVKSAFIFLHGYEDEGSSYRNLAEQIWNAGDLQHTRFIFPTAPVNHAHAATAWYTLHSVPSLTDDNPDSPDDSLENYKEALDTVDRLINEQVGKEVPLEKIVLGGFSQGGAVTLLHAVIRPRKLAGTAVVSSYLPLRGQLKEIAAKFEGTRSKTLIMHGLIDRRLPVQVIQKAQKPLEEIGFDFDWLEIPEMQHALTGLSIAVLKTFLSNQLE